MLQLSKPGEDNFRAFPQRGSSAESSDSPLIRHGSSLDLISKATILLNEEFTEIDPEEDFRKWSDIGAQPYFLTCIEQPSQIMSCCLRCLLDGDWAAASLSCPLSSPPSPPCPLFSQTRFKQLFDAAVANGVDPTTAAATALTDLHKEQGQQGQQGVSSFASAADAPPEAPLRSPGGTNESCDWCKHRLVVDYVVTVEQCQGRGYASHLLELVMDMAKAARANVYVLALEDSCVYWMSKGFVLEDGPINRRLNIFPDTHLLKLPSNRPEDPMCIPPPEPQTCEKRASAASSDQTKPERSDGNNSGNSEKERERDRFQMSDVSDDMATEEAELQQALMQSMVQQLPHQNESNLQASDDDNNTRTFGWEVSSGGKDGHDSELQAVIMQSMAKHEELSTNVAPDVEAAGSSRECENNKEQSRRGSDEEDVELARAIAMSLEGGGDS